MIFEGQFTLHAPIQQVWDTFMNPEILASCVPGCEKMDVIEDRTWDCVVAAKVGSISARFRFTAELVELDPPKHIRATGSGDEMGKAATFTMDMVADLVEITASEVQVSYRTNVHIVGRLATFGDRIMKAKAKQVQDQLTAALAERLASPAPAQPTGPAPAQPASPAPAQPASPAPAVPAAASPAPPPALRMTLWELIVVFFAGLWDLVKKPFGGKQE